MTYSGKNNIWNATINNRYAGTTTYYAVATDTIGQETTSSTYSYTCVTGGKPAPL